jgi:lipopolysaccharide transport system ATP-binding protein
MKPAIRAENLSKEYRLGVHRQESYRTLRESLVRAAAAPLRRLRRAKTTGRPDRFWALKDVSFEVPPGEVVGIIGRNGAGKSTLLKILSHITEPTSGRIAYRGRIASLLEVGTGFHPELTGRENIYLNGSILGMTRREIGRKFDEIVAFAEIKRFLDTPVKRYSSGMYVRLAFAVAAHLEPEILVIDEVLAVGDQEFQRKCLGKMAEISRSERTALFVSHNMAAVQNLCGRTGVLQGGRLVFFGDTADAIEIYTRGNEAGHEGEIDLTQQPRHGAGGPPVLRRLRLLDGNGRATNRFSCGEPAAFEIELDWQGPPASVNICLGVSGRGGARVFTVATFLAKEGPVTLSGRHSVTCHVPELPLPPGRYSVDLYAKPLYLPPVDQIDAATWFDVLPADYYGNGRLPEANLGSYLVRSHWVTQS